MRSAGVLPPSTSMRSASFRAASKCCTSFISCSAWSGVLPRSRRLHEDSRLGASKFDMYGCGAVRVVHTPECRCEIIQQFRMARQISLSAEIAARFDQARAEELLPVTIDGDARRHGMLRRHEPLREIKAIRARPRLQERRQEA